MTELRYVYERLEHLALDEEQESFRSAACELRKLYNAIRPARPSTTREREHALEALATLRHILKAATPLDRRYKEGLREATPLTYENRLASINRENGIPWRFELFEAPRWGVTTNELSYIRKRARKNFETAARAFCVASASTIIPMS